MRATYRFVVEQAVRGRLAGAEINVLAPLPGTPYWEQAVEGGLVGPPESFDWAPNADDGNRPMLLIGHHRCGIRWRNVGHISSLAEKKPYVFEPLHAVAENAHGVGNPPALATRPGVECCSSHSSQAVDWMRRSRSRPVSKPISCNR